MAILIQSALQSITVVTVSKTREFRVPLYFFSLKLNTSGTSASQGRRFPDPCPSVVVLLSDLRDEASCMSTRAYIMAASSWPAGAGTPASRRTFETLEMPSSACVLWEDLREESTGTCCHQPLLPRHGSGHFQSYLPKSCFPRGGSVVDAAKIFL